MSQSAGSLHDCPHGALTARVLGPVLEYNAPAAPERHARVSRRSASRPPGSSSTEAALASVAAVDRLTEDVDIPTMVESSASADEIPLLARMAFDDPQTTGNARDVDVAAYERIYGSAFAQGLPLSTATSTDYRMVVAGKWVESESGERLEATKPGDRRGDRQRSAGTREDARRAIAAAGAAWRDWAARTPFPARGGARARRRADRRPRRARGRSRSTGQAVARRGLRRGRQARRILAHGRGRRPGWRSSLPPSVDASKRVLARNFPLASST